MKKKSLTPGASAHIYHRDGDLLDRVEVPESGAFVVEHLPPGAYTCTDTCGGYVDFDVSPDEKYTTIWEPRSGRADVVGGASPGESAVFAEDVTRDTEPWHPLNHPSGVRVGGTGADAPKADKIERVQAAEHVPAIPRREAPEEFPNDASVRPGGPGFGRVTPEPQENENVVAQTAAEAAA